MSRPGWRGFAPFVARFGAGLIGGLAACLAHRARDVSLLPDGCRCPGLSGRAGSRTGREPGRVAAPQASLRRAARDPDHRAVGKQGGGYVVVRAPARPRVRAAAWLRSSLRLPRFPRGHGAFRVRAAGQSEARPRRRSGGQTWGRSRAARVRAGLMRPAVQVTGGSATGHDRRAARRTRRRAAAGRRRSWRCCGLPCPCGR